MVSFMQRGPARWKMSVRVCGYTMYMYSFWEVDGGREKDPLMHDVSMSLYNHLQGEGVQARRQDVCLGRASTEKLAGGGGGRGTRTHFFRLQSPPPKKKVKKKNHNGVGLLSSWTWPTADLTSKKKLGGNCLPAPPPPLPLAPRLSVCGIELRVYIRC